jgi:threonine/homoserine/homoserine lactone efflux protein
VTPEPSTLALFMLAALALLLVPGPAVLYIVTRSMDQGRAAGLVSVAGIATGTLVHVVAAAAGLSALLVSSAAAYNVVRWAGAGYLIVLGVRRLLTREAAGEVQPVRAWSLRRTYGQGVIVNVLNPKTTLFVFALLPQFIDPERGSVAVQALVLGLTLVVLGMLSDGTYAVAASAVGDRLRRNARTRRALERASGAVYIALGALALLGSRPDPARAAK